MVKTRRMKRSRKQKKTRKAKHCNQYGGACEDIKNQPEGFFLFCNVITEEEERGITEKILSEEEAYYEQTNAGFGTRSFKLVTDKMPEYLKDTSLETLFTNPTVLEGKLLEVRKVIDEVGEFDANHFLVNRYVGGVGISPHRNSVDYGPIIIGISLGDSCKFILSPRSGVEGEVFEYIVPPRSIYIMSGMSRYRFNHEIPPLPEDTKRISITIRDSAPKTVHVENSSSTSAAASAAAPTTNSANVFNNVNTKFSKNIRRINTNNFENFM